MNDDEQQDLSWTTPVDFAILAELPNQGSRLGYHQLAATVKVVGEKINIGVPDEGQMSTAILSRRMVELRKHGLVVPVRVHGAGATKGWQRTLSGTAALNQGREEGLA